LAYTFARIGSVVNLKVEDYYPSGKRFLLRFKEKGGKEKELPVHHKLEEILDTYLKTTGLEKEPESPLFPAAVRKTGKLSRRPLARTDAAEDGSNKPDCRLTIRRTHSGRPALRIFWKMTAPWKPLSGSLATPTAGPRNSTTAAARRFSSRTWKESDTERQKRTSRVGELFRKIGRRQRVEFFVASLAEVPQEVQRAVLDHRAQLWQGLVR
jgi:hypothetical protein